MALNRIATLFVFAVLVNRVNPRLFAAERSELLARVLAAEAWSVLHP
jgi:hypothetical protein